MAVQSHRGFIARTIQNSASGTIAGIAVTLAGHPFDTLKVRLQTQPVHKPVYRGLADCFVKTLKWEGIGGLYRGVGSPLAGQMFFRAVLFTSYYQIQTLLAGKDKAGRRLSTMENFMAGVFTGGVVSFVESPIDLFKTKMQVQIIRAKSGAAVQYRNVFHAGWVIVKTYGVRGAYQGLGATLLRDAPSFALFFGVFEMCRTAFTPPGGTVDDLKGWQIMVGGAVGGFMFWSLTYPTDVIKSAMQSDDSDKSKRKYRNIRDCAKRLYREEGGWRRFYRGYSPCIMRSIFANALQLFFLEKSRQLLSW